ncbi:hypothetical protein AMS68_003501 [Peltaster fructicola]|uniref:Major facilitator superfamily (MFS) profile domain-containing protein n=1 Tax=Peltaster fructicola TaxID=286661 RepID=A0A6H0XTC0_9PEZI|nr:hypothetical protein AMS68_003501 [Peltaster fructicola]
MFANGAAGLILALFFAELHFSDARIGVFMTLTMVGDVILGTWLTLIADRVGRRKILMAGSVLMILTGALFAVFENYWLLLFAAVVGVVSATGGDFGPFRAIEESILSQLTTLETRTDVLSWYVTLSTWGSAIGSEAGGRIFESLQQLDGWTATRAYHAIFWLYAVMGVVNVVIVLLLTNECEAAGSTQDYTKLPAEDDDVELDESPREPQDPASLQTPLEAPRSIWGKAKSWFSTRITSISAPTRSVMYKLWILLAVDSISDGMVPYSLTNYYMDVTFHPSKATLGDVTSVAYLLGAISSMFAGPLAKKLGLINTMVFTHVPSSAAVLLFGLPNAFWLCAILLFVRAGLNNMDQSPRSAFIAAVVKPEERTAVMGITSTIRTLAATAGPGLTGLLAENDRFWVAFVVGGALRLTYDLGLYVLFVNMKIEGEKPRQSINDESSTPSDGEESVELAVKTDTSV